MRELPVDALALDQYRIPINPDYLTCLVVILNNIPCAEKACVILCHVYSRKKAKTPHDIHHIVDAELRNRHVHVAKKKGFPALISEETAESPFNRLINLVIQLKELFRVELRNREQRHKFPSL